MRPILLLLMLLGVAACGAVQPATSPPPYGRGGTNSGGNA